jgi:hypothetical protein
MNKLIISALLCAAPIFASISSSVSVGYPSAPQTQGCTSNRSDAALNVCYATLNGSRAVAVADTWSPGSLDFIVSGMIGESIPSGGSTTLTATTSTTITDYAGQGHNVFVENYCDDTGGNCQAVGVYLNSSLVATLSAGQSTTITYQSGQFDIMISVTRAESTAGGDYVGYFPGVELTAVP